MTAYEKGVELSKAGKFDAALIAFETARAENPRDYRTHFGIGWALQKLDRHDDAIKSFTAAIELNSEVSGLFYSRAASSLMLNRGDEALHDLDKALAISPNDLEAVYARGNSLKALQRSEEAIVEYSKVIAADNCHIGAHDGRAKLRHQTGDFPGAIADFTRCLELGRDTYGIRLLRGLAYQYSGQQRQAIDDLTIAITMQPENGSTYFRRAYSYKELNDHQNEQKDLATGNKLTDVATTKSK